MEPLKYTLIYTKKQYSQYCDELESLLLSDNQDKNTRFAIDLLTLLIETWQDEHNTLKKLEPVELIKVLMKEHKLNQDGLAQILGIGKSLVSEILNYKKGISKEVTKKLAHHFKLREEAFSKNYELKGNLEMA